MVDIYDQVYYAWKVETDPNSVAAKLYLDNEDGDATGETVLVAGPITIVADY